MRERQIFHANYNKLKAVKLKYYNFITNERKRMFLKKKSDSIMNKAWHNWP